MENKQTPLTEIYVGLRFNEETRIIGKMAYVAKEIYFEYDKTFLKTEINISPFNLALKKGALKNNDNVFEGLFGVFNDSLPDGWGRLLTDRFFIKNGIPRDKINLLERLSMVGLNGPGALVYSPDKSELLKNKNGEVNLNTLNKDIKTALDGKTENVIEKLLILNGSSSGARPKSMLKVSEDKKSIIYDDNALIEGYSEWIIKFTNSNDNPYSGNIEYAYSLMVKSAGIQMEETFLFEGKDNKNYFGIKRFDRTQKGRLHMHSLCGLVHSDYRVPSLDYDDLLTVTSALTKNMQDVHKAFKLACFNVLSHNRDDHEKNVCFLMQEDGSWSLAPAYDITPSSGPNGWQSMAVMGEAKNPSILDLKKLAKEHGIKNVDNILKEVIQALTRWEEFAKIAKVPAKEIKELSRYLFRT